MPKKSYTRTGRSCRVTFYLPAEVEANSVALCGEFNDWNAEAHPMRRKKDGSHFVSLSLEAGRAYRYRFLVDGSRWENDWQADEYRPNEFGSDDSVVSI
ncbi:MAG: isoamylase early set domain-containing protein [Bacteroidota bacterium]|nr:isoamylase early set domain-containing protein [Bacteroidota bacterium]